MAKRRASWVRPFDRPFLVDGYDPERHLSRSLALTYCRLQHIVALSAEFAGGATRFPSRDHKPAAAPVTLQAAPQP